ncbi:MAG: hypothetical protein A2020_01800 [Lentisphaerae bacterium GWF2_45_14]|nr:MAG: hypothetical protein A2020_01800 [Lentisphaerae bacterium GWF2_45_14]
MNNKITEIYKVLLSDIAQGKIVPGQTFPKETELAEKFETNRMNAYRAMKELEKNGFLVRRKKAGSFLKEHIDKKKLHMLFNKFKRIIYLLCSAKPCGIHWNEASFRGLEEEVARENYTVIYRNIPNGETSNDLHAILDEASDRGASALVIFPDVTDTEFLEDNSILLLNFMAPIFMLNRTGGDLHSDMVSYVSMDPFGDGIFVGSLLSNNNCRNVIMLNEHSERAYWGLKRYEGLKMGMKKNNPNGSFRLENIIGTKYGVEKCVDMAKQLGQDTVVVPVNNEYAAWFIDSASKKGLRIPEECRVISFDDNPLFRSYNLTTMAPQTKEIGKVFGQMICGNSWINSHYGKISVRIPQKLIIRDTFTPQKT